jgi:hypothetical protein
MLTVIIFESRLVVDGPLLYTSETLEPGIKARPDKVRSVSEYVVTPLPAKVMSTKNTALRPLDCEAEQGSHK